MRMRRTVAALFNVFSETGRPPSAMMETTDDDATAAFLQLTFNGRRDKKYIDPIYIVLEKMG